MKRTSKKIFTTFLTFCWMITLIGGIPMAYAEDMIQQLLCTSFTVTPGGVAEITVSINDNIGFCNLGLVMTYDSALQPLVNEEGDPVYQIGEVAQNQYSVTSNNPEKHLLTFAMSGSQNIETNGKLFTVYFQIPIDAPIGKGYTIDLQAKLVSDCHGNSLLEKTQATGSCITVADKDGRTGITEDQIIISLGNVEAHAGATAVIPIKIKQNPGFATCGIRVIYDTAVTPKTNLFGTPNYELGRIGQGLSPTVYLNKSEHMIGFQAAKSIDCTGDGTIFTLPFVIPTNAVAGDTYNFIVQVDYMNDAASTNLLDRVVVQPGEVNIPQESTATVSTTTTTTTTTTRKTTTTTQKTTTTTTKKTTPSTTTTTTTTSTLTEPKAEIVVRGDANVDNKVSIADVVLVSRYINEEPVSITTQGRINADVNTDSILDASDAATILKIIAKLVK